MPVRGQAGLGCGCGVRGLVTLSPAPRLPPPAAAPSPGTAGGKSSPPLKPLSPRRGHVRPRKSSGRRGGEGERALCGSSQKQDLHRFPLSAFWEGIRQKAFRAAQGTHLVDAGVRDVVFLEKRNRNTAYDHLFPTSCPLKPQPCTSNPGSAPSRPLRRSLPSSRPAPSARRRRGAMRVSGEDAVRGDGRKPRERCHRATLGHGPGTPPRSGSAGKHRSRTSPLPKGSPERV